MHTERERERERERDREITTINKERKKERERERGQAKEGPLRGRDHFEQQLDLRLTSFSTDSYRHEFVAHVGGS